MNTFIEAHMVFKIVINLKKKHSYRKNGHILSIQLNEFSKLSTYPHNKHPDQTKHYQKLKGPLTSPS